eukprot:scaffold44612_cov58-Phaeocystis_antarctica.AAC.2
MRTLSANPKYTRGISTPGCEDCEDHAKRHCNVCKAKKDSGGSGGAGGGSGSGDGCSDAASCDGVALAHALAALSTRPALASALAAGRAVAVRHLERAVAARYRAEQPPCCKAFTTSVPAAIVVVKADREECACRAHSTRSCTTSNDVRCEASCSERPRLCQIPDQFAKVPAAPTQRLLGATRWRIGADVCTATVTSGRIYDGPQCCAR